MPRTAAVCFFREAVCNSFAKNEKAASERNNPLLLFSALRLAPSLLLLNRSRSRQRYAERMENPPFKKKIVNPLKRLWAMGLHRFFKRLSIGIAGPLFLLLGLIGCAEDSPNRSPAGAGAPPPIIAQIRIAPNSATLGIGAEEQFVATVLDGEGEELAGTDVIWQIDNPTAASVSPDGWVKGLQEGTATLTASVGEKISNPAALSVVTPPAAAPVASIEVTSTHKVLFVGNQARFTAIAKDINGRPLPGVTFDWASSDPETAPIDRRGLATALAPGDVTITATVQPPEDPLFTPANDTQSQSAPLTVSNDNSPPIATITTSARRGPAPFTVAFSGTRSDDPDDWITLYTWDFGDGSRPFYAPTARHTYESTGEFIATLTVIDTEGATSVASVQITVDP